jgi:ABC-type Fe3+-hydroxamate transport system substrate-binding protein
MMLMMALCMVGCRNPVAPVARDGSVERLVVMAPAAAEMIDRLGLANRVVGVGNFVDWPPVFADLPRVGLHTSPNMEQVLALETDLFITARGVAAAGKGRRLEDLGVEVLALETGTYDGVFASLLRLGDRLGCPERARLLEQGMRDRVAAVASRAQAAPRKSVLVLVGHDPLYVAGPGSHIDRLIALAGGKNAAYDSHAPYQIMSMEVILARRPEIIVDISDNRPDAFRGRQPGRWADLQIIPAVAANNVYWVDPQRLSIPGPRLPEMAELMGKIIHPEIFGEPATSELGRLQPPDPVSPSGSGP